MSAHRLENAIATHGRLVAGLLLLGGVLAVRSWIVAPHLASLKAAQQYGRAIDERIEKGKQIGQRLRGNRKRVEALTAEYSLLSGMAFSTAKADEFFSDIEAFCSQSGCLVVSLSFSSDHDGAVESSNSLIVAKGAALTICGRYGSIIKLIEILQARPEKVWIDEVRMAGLASGPDEVACQLTIAIYVDMAKEGVGYENSPED